MINGQEYVSIPSRGFWFFEVSITANAAKEASVIVSIPSRGFWFFEASVSATINGQEYAAGFNPLAGILVF